MSTDEGKTEYESFEYKHPLGFLTLLLDHKEHELIMVSFTPCADIEAKKITSIDWYFKNGEFTGWGTGQNGWRHELRRKKGKVASRHPSL